MSKFEKSEWKNRESAQEFIENSEMYILERQRLLKIMKSLFKHFIYGKNENNPIKTLDLGCGDGILTEQLLKVDRTLEGTLVDGSDEMLENAKNRLKSYPKLKYVQTTFQELIKKDLSVKFDFIVSSLAIHHLSMDQKESLFKYIYDHLNIDGLFLNIDAIKAPSTDLEEFYLTLWKEWIIEKEIQTNPLKSFQHIPTQYKNNNDNHPDTLKKQLNSLESIGFKNVDCYYKYGIFSVYGGQK